MELPSSFDDSDSCIAPEDQIDQKEQSTDDQVILSPNQTAALGCIACLTDGGETPAGNVLKPIAACNGITLPSATYSVKSLAAHGLVKTEERTKKPVSGQQMASKHLYNLTSAGIAQLPDSWQPCPETYTHKNPLLIRSSRQQKIASCIACLEQQGEAPTAKNVTACLGIRASSVDNDLRNMATDGLLTSSVEPENSNHSARTDTVTYKPTTNSAEYLKAPPKENCTFANTTTERRLAQLTPHQRQILGCIACISQKTNNPYGAEKAAVEACGELSADARYGKKLQELGMIEQHAGFVKAGGSNPRRIFYSLTEEAKAIVKIMPDRECQTPEASEQPPLHISDTVKRCLDCIWSRQVAHGAEFGATPIMISTCTGISRHLAGKMLTTMALRGEITRGEVSTDIVRNNRKQVTIAFSPPDTLTQLRPPEECELGVYSDIPAEYLKPVVFEKLGRIGKSTSATSIGLGEYIKTKKHHTLLTKEQEVALGTIIQDPNSSEQEREQAVAAFVEHNVRLAIWYSVNKSHFEGLFLGFDDRTQAALLGIEAAARRFDPSFEARFNSYAMLWMKQRIQRTAAAHIGVPVNKFTRIPTTYYAAADFEARHGRRPSLLELAHASNVTPKKIVEVVEARAVIKKHALSLDHELDGSHYTNRLFGSSSLHDLVGLKQDDFESIEIFEALQKMTPYLEDYEKFVLSNALGHHTASRAHIAEKFGVKAHAVQAAEARINALLRHPYFGVNAGRQSHEWQLDAACATTNTSAVIERENNRDVPKEIAKLCGFCPVRKECFVETLRGDQPVQSGIWAGFTPRELRAYYKRSRSTRVTKKSTPETSIAHS